jgi:methyl-accepting chemotaxis protein
MSNKSSLALALVLLFILPVFLPMINVNPVVASTGQPKLGAVDSDTAPTSLVIAADNVSLRLDGPVEKVDGVATAGYFTIIFGDNVTGWYVTFSGSQFDLYVSTDGYSSITSGVDVLFAGSFFVADLTNTYKAVTVSTPLGSRTFYIGAVVNGSTTYYVIVGALTAYVPRNYKYIKIFDGISTAVAVSIQTVDILPTLMITPTEGSAGTSAIISGAGFAANSVVELSYVSPVTGSIANVTTDSQGMFTYGPFRIVDLKNDYAPPGYDDIVIDENVTGYQVTFREYQRRLIYLSSSLQTISVDMANGTATLYVYIFDTVNVTGNFFFADSVVNLYIGTTNVGSATTNGTGFFTLTFTVPELPLGYNTVKIIDGNNVLFNFSLYVNPTLVLTPNTGPVGTVVTATAYGFPANSLVYIYWEDIVGHDGYYWMVNATTGPDGKFNVTVTFTVPKTWGGPWESHYVYALSYYYGSFTTYISSPDIIAWAAFSVTPTIVIERSVITNDGSEFYIYANGLAHNYEYIVWLDHDVLFSTDWWSLEANDTGELIIDLVAAGFRPGLHIISLTEWTGYFENYINESEMLYVLFTVTTEGDLVVEDINANTDAGFANVVSMLTGISSDISALSDAVDTGFSNVLAQLSALNTAIADLTLDVSALNASIAALHDHLSAVHSDIMGALSDLSSSLAAVSASLSSLHAAVSDLQAAIADVQSQLGSISESLAALESALADLSASLADLSAALDSAVADLSAKIDDVGSAVADLEAALGNLATKSEVAAVSSKVDNVASGLSAMSADVSDALGSLSSLITATAVLVVITLIVAAVATFKVFRG